LYKTIVQGLLYYLLKEFELVMHIKRTSNLAQLIEQYLLIEKSDSEYYESLLKSSSQLSKTSEKSYQNDFDDQHKSSLVNLFSGLELTIEEFIANTIYAYPDSLNIISDAVQSTAVQNKLPMSTFDDARGILNILKRINFGKGIIGINTYIEILNNLDVNIDVDEEVILHLNELKEVRNSIVHKGSVIDKKCVRNAPSLASFQGEFYKVGTELYNEYYNSIKTIHAAFRSAVIKSTFYLSKAK